MESSVAQAGMVIGGRYRLDAEIGHGGYSRVFRATELKLSREVALKLLSQDSVDIAGAQRFQREAELARQLTHPNTVRLLDFDLEGKPSPYIVFEMLQGETLDRIVKRGGAMSEERVVRLVTQVLKSLMEAHAAGIVHRDMKPGNVFVCTYAGEPDFVKVLDFGIAKSTVGGEVALTAAGTLVGTPRYMPPEQIHGATPAPSMDLYAIGMMMAEMLAGVPVLRGTPMEACMAQLANTPIEFPEAAQRSALWAIIRRAATKDVAARYSSADQMLADLTQVKPSAIPDAAPFAVREEALPSGQVATQVMADPSVLLPETGLASSPVSSGRAATVFAPLEAPAPELVPFEAIRAPSSVLSPKLPKPPPKSRRGLFAAAFLLVLVALTLSSYLGLRLWRHHESSAVPAGR